MEPATPTNLAKRKSHAHGLLAAAQHESLRGFSDNELFYKGFSGMTQVETKWAEMRASTEVSDQEKLEALLDDEVLWEKRKQRNQDLSNDHPIALFTRMKFQSPARLYLALVLLTLVHLIQIGAMYNLTGLSSYLVTDKIAIMLERGDWMTTNPLLLVAQHNASTFPDIVHGYLNSSEILLPGTMREFGFCLSNTGFMEVVFNITVGLFLVYMFIFADLWRVVFAMTVTRSLPGDPNLKLVLMGVVWLIVLNSLILAWLGAESGLSVVASGGEFSAVLFNSLTNFIILSLDDGVLPMLRFVLEENGHMDLDGFMGRKQLDLLTHGAQYYKPGYGAQWMNTIRHAPQPMIRIIALINIPIVLSIVLVPLGISVASAVNSYEVC